MHDFIFIEGDALTIKYRLKTVTYPLGEIDSMMLCKELDTSQFKYCLILFYVLILIMFFLFPGIDELWYCIPCFLVCGVMGFRDKGRYRYYVQINNTCCKNVRVNIRSKDKVQVLGEIIRFENYNFLFKFYHL